MVFYVGKLRRDGRTWVLTGEPPGEDVRAPWASEQGSGGAAHRA
jgi:hypothetical protein